MSRGSKVVFGAKGAVLHEPRARLVASMFTFWAKKMEYRVEPRRTHRMPASSDTSGVSVELTQTSPSDRNSERQTGLAFKAPSLAMAIRRDRYPTGRGSGCQYGCRNNGADHNWQYVLCQLLCTSPYRSATIAAIINIANTTSPMWSSSARRPLLREVRAMNLPHHLTGNARLT